MAEIMTIQEISRDRTKVKIDRLKIKLDKIVNDPKMLKEVEEFHREASALSYRDLWKRFMACCLVMCLE